MSRTLHIVATFAALVAALFIADSWRTAHRNSAQLTTTLAAQNALIEQAAAQEQQRNTQLSAALASIATEKKRVQTPQQAVEAIPSVLPPLPLPVKVSLPDITPSPKPGDESPASISIPQSDLKPLYDSLQDCRACALERDATKQDLAGEQADVAALTRERDAAIAAAHGGNFWSRLKQATKWFMVGVVAGAAATAASHR
jgi:small-conductance mechanosensitive channel